MTRAQALEQLRRLYGDDAELRVRHPSTVAKYPKNFRLRAAGRIRGLHMGLGFFESRGEGDNWRDAVQAART